jgi:hypothetical protein
LSEKEDNCKEKGERLIDINTISSIVLSPSSSIETVIEISEFSKFLCYFPISLPRSLSLSSLSFIFLWFLDVYYDERACEMIWNSVEGFL